MPGHALINTANFNFSTDKISNDDSVNSLNSARAPHKFHGSFAIPASRRTEVLRRTGVKWNARLATLTFTRITNSFSHIYIYEYDKKKSNEGKRKKKQGAKHADSLIAAKDHFLGEARTKEPKEIISTSCNSSGGSRRVWDIYEYIYKH